MGQNKLYSTNTVGELIHSALQRYSDRTAFIDGDATISYRELKERISQVVQALASLGLKKGDTVAQLSANRPQTFMVTAAVYISGLRMVALHAMAGEDDHAYIINDSEAKAVVIDPYYAERAKSLRQRCAGVAHWAAHGDLDGMTNLWRQADEFTPQSLCPAGDGEDIIRLAYTGGTTGRPKGVMLSNRALVTNAILELSGKDWPEEVRYVCPAPISHGGGSLLIPVLMRGGSVLLQPGFNAERFQDAVETHHCNVTWLVPTMVYALLDHPRTRQIDWSCMRSFIYSAAPMTPSRIREALQVFGPCLIQSYGQTESPNTILTLSRADHATATDERLASAGKPYPSIRVALLDENCEEVAEGEVGEICVRGPLVMSGYWKQPEQTADAFKGDWLHTGDMARRDADGFYTIVDRKKDMVISGGFNVYPKEVEDVLASHPAIAAAAVIGVHDEKWGEAVKAIVKLKPGCSVTPAELIEMVRAAKGPVHAPKSVDMADDFPLTALGKIDKKALRIRYRQDA